MVEDLDDWMAALWVVLKVALSVDLTVVYLVVSKDFCSVGKKGLAMVKKVVVLKGRSVGCEDGCEVGCLEGFRLGELEGFSDG